MRQEKTPVPPGSAPPPRRRGFGRRAAHALLTLGAVAILLGLAAWLARDYPRRWLQDRLSLSLDAQVRLQRLSIEDRHHLVLYGVDVRDVRWESRVESVAVERIDVVGSLWEMSAGRFESVVLDGVDARLIPPTRQAASGPASTLRAAHVEIRRGRLAVTAGPATAEVGFQATLTNWGDASTGSIALTAERFQLEPWIAVLSEFDPAGAAPPTDGVGAAVLVGADLRADARLPEGDEPWRVDARAGRVRLSFQGRAVVLERPVAQATYRGPDALGAALHVQLRSALDGVDAVQVDAEFDPGTLALRGGSGTLAGMRLEELFEGGSTLPGGLTVAGRGDLRVHSADGAFFEYALLAELTHFDLPLAGGALRGDEVRASLRGAWDGSVGSLETHPLDYEADARCGTLRLEAGATEVLVPGATLTARGRLDTTWSGPTVARLSLPAGSGALGGRALPADLFPVDADLDGTLLVASHAVFEGTGDLRSPAVGRLRVEGSTGFGGAVPAARWSWRWSDAPGIEALRAATAGLGRDPLPAYLGVDGRPSAAGRLSGRLSDPAVGGALNVDGLRIATTVGAVPAGVAGWSLSEGALATRLRREPGDGGAVRVDDLSLTGRALHAGDVGGGARDGDARAAAGWDSPLDVTAAGAFDVLRGSLRLNDARIDLARLGVLRVDGGIEPDRSVALSAALQPVDLPRIRELSHLWLDDPLPDYTIRGSLASRLEVRRDPDGLWLTRGELDLSAAGLGSADATRVVEGAVAHADVVLSSRRGGDIAGEAAITVDGPVFLWGTLFGDFSSLSSNLSLRARRDAGRWEASADGSLPHGVAFHGGLTATIADGLGDADVADGVPASTPTAFHPGRRRVEYAFTADLPDLSAVLEHYVRAPFEGSVDRIDTLGAAGALHVELAGALDPDGRTVEGTLRATDASFSGPEGETRIDGLSLALPISLSWVRGTDGDFDLRDGAEFEGRLGYRSLRLAGVEFPALDTRLTVVSDTVRLDRALHVALLDGDIQLERVALADWTRPERDLRFGLRLTGLSLAALTRELDTFPLAGTLNATVPAVRLTPARLEVDGGGTVEIFGGRVTVFDISGQDVLGRFPKLRFSADLEHIQLLDLTHTFDFGEVYGVVGGEIRDCELFGGTPVRCEATVKSVKTRGMPQKISVKAIRNISILGSGPRVGFLDRGLQKFLDKYTYSRLGFTMTLDRDRFVLRGTERRGERELFVRGRLPFRIDIVNAAPGQGVSFQTMMQRLGNLQVAAPDGRSPAERRAAQANSPE